jgi:hypothetical protein
MQPPLESRAFSDPRVNYIFKFDSSRLGGDDCKAVHSHPIDEMETVGAKRVKCG